MYQGANEDTASVSTIISSEPIRQVCRNIQLRFLTEEEKRAQYRIEEEQENTNLSRGSESKNGPNFCFKLISCCFVRAK